MSFTQASWAQDFLKRLGYPVTENNVTTVLAWEYQEGGHFANDAKNNPLNTTMDHGKYGSINSAGVATYPNYETGMKETIATIKLDSYSKVRHDLATNASPATTTAAIAASPWGTWHGGISRDGALDRARKFVKDHPSVAKDKDGKGTGGKDGKDGKDGRDGRDGKDGKNDGRGGKKTAGGGSKHSKKIVLDLQELDRLGKVYRTASDDIVRHRKVVGDIAAAIEPARAALPDKGLANVIQATFNWLLEPGGGFDKDARLHDELSAYVGDIHRLAEEADSNNNGTWGRSEAMAFAAKHKGEDGAALAAVMAALGHGTIVRKTKAGSGGSGGSGGKNGSGGSGGSSGGGGGGGEKATGRKAKVDKMLDFAGKQHANDGGNNTTKYNKWYGIAYGQPWCAAFVSYVFAHSGNPLPAMQTKQSGFAHCQYAIDYARKHGQLDSKPQVGDIFLRKDAQHTGIVSKVNPDGSFETIEGNAGPATDRVYHGKRSNDGQYYFWTAIR